VEISPAWIRGTGALLQGGQEPGVVEGNGSLNRSDGFAGGTGNRRQEEAAKDADEGDRAEQLG